MDHRPKLKSKTIKHVKNNKGDNLGDLKFVCFKTISKL